MRHHNAPLYTPDKETELRPFDAATIAATPYDPTEYQAVVFVAKSFGTMVDEIERYLERV